MWLITFVNLSAGFIITQPGRIRKRKQKISSHAPQRLYRPWCCPFQTATGGAAYSDKYIDAFIISHNFLKIKRMLGFPLILLLKELHLIMDGLLLVAVQGAECLHKSALRFVQSYWRDRFVTKTD